MRGRSASRANISPTGTSTSGRRPISGRTRNSGRRPAIRRPRRNAAGAEGMPLGIFVAGNPDTVYKQIMDIYDKVGGFGHLVFIGRSGFLRHQEAKKSIRLMAKEVLPRLPEITVTPELVPQAAE